MAEFPGDPYKGATVDDLAWLTGHWRGHRGDVLGAYLQRADGVVTPETVFRSTRVVA